MQASVLSIMNQKGGTGKTTTTVNLGVALAQTGKKVLLLDLDPQGSMTWHFGLTDLQKDLTDVFFGETDFQAIFVEKENLTIAPSSIELANVELALASHTDRTHTLLKLLEPIRADFDMILIDCAPSLSLLTINALTASDKILIPLRPEVLALKGLTLISKTIQQIQENYNPNLQVLGILLVMVDLRIAVTQEIYEHLVHETAFDLFETHIELDEKIIEAPSFGTSTLNYAPNSSGSRAYRRLANEILPKFNA